jgi:uncharacterized membrane protein YvbJ
MSGRCARCGRWINADSGMCSSCSAAQYNEEKLVKEQLKQLKSAKKQNNTGRRMHWIYFFVFGWIIGSLLVIFVFPLFVKGLVSKAFGYW